MSNYEEMQRDIAEEGVENVLKANAEINALPIEVELGNLEVDQVTCADCGGEKEQTYTRACDFCHHKAESFDAGI